MMSKAVLLTLVFGVTAHGESLAAARAEFAACRFEKAAELYGQATVNSPTDGDAWYGLVRSQIDGHHAKLAYASAEEALQKAASTSGAQAAAGIAAFRRGEIAKSERYFLEAIKLKQDDAGALLGLSRAYASVSLRRKSRNVMLKAWSLAPDDPALALAHANTLEGSAHFAALEALLQQLDPGSDEAKGVRGHLANDKALGDRKFRELASPYENTKINLMKITNGPSQLRGVGLSVVFNEKHKVTLLLDTGASGISISPKSADKAGLIQGGAVSSEAKGIGDSKGQISYRHLVEKLRVGTVVFNNYPVQVFRSARDADIDGLIGADVFARFLVTLDFPQMVLSLETRPGEPEDDKVPYDAKPPAAGFQRVFRFGDHLGIPTAVNDSLSALFLIDSGSNSNLIDSEFAASATKVHRDTRTVLKGVQGRVQNVSRADKVSLRFAGLTQDNPDLLALDLERTGDSLGSAMGGVIGMPVLFPLRLTIDYREGTVRFEYKPR